MADLVSVGLGANLGDLSGQLRSALAELCELDRVQLVSTSSLYESAPVGYLEQPQFLNAVIQLFTDLSPLELLDSMQRIEANHRRQRDIHWGPRTLDLDLLLYGRARIRSQRLCLPHPHMLHRAFVLVPLIELAPSLRHPCTGLPITRHRRLLGREQALHRVGPFPLP
jgi:2-amino-4-hydroxy-6-hydroxymethyldihydropteridine diphosphokinase